MKACIGFVWPLRNCLTIKKKRLYKPYIEIIKQHWDQQLKKNIHSIVYWLNPCFQYDQENFCYKPIIIGGVMDVTD